MQLTAALLYQNLNEQFPIAEYRLPSPRQPLSRPFFYEEQEELRPGHIYLTDRFLPAPVFQALPREVCMVFCGGDFKSPLPDCRASIIKLCFDTPLPRVCNCIQSIFDRYESWEESLHSLAGKGGSLHDLLDISRPVFRNPLCITGMNGVPAAFSGAEEVPKLQKILSDSSLRLQYANAFDQDESCQLPPAKKTPVLFPDHITGNRSLNQNLFVADQAEYRLSVIENNNPITEADYDLIQVLAHFAETILRRQRSESSSRSNALQSIFQSLLNDSAAEESSVSKMLEKVGWQTDHLYFCALFQAGSSGLASLNPKAVCQYLQEMFPSSCSLIKEEQPVCFFNLTLLGMDTDDVCQKLVYFIRDSFLKVGYSRAMEGHQNLRYLYLQAKTALEMGSELYPQLWIHQFNQIALPCLFKDAVSTFPGEMLCHEKLLRLRKTDLEQGTEYMKTLKVYLRHNCNAVQSAKELFIHRSTLLYRLERIKHLLESDLEDPEELFYLNLSMRLLDSR